MRPRTTSSILFLVLSGAAAHAQASTHLWCDADRDGRADLYLVRPGADDVLLRNAGDGGFADVTAASGLAGLRSRQVVLGEADGDGVPDLLRVDASGELRLHVGDGAGRFVDATAEAGLAGRVARSARWGDLDGDGRADLELVHEDGRLSVLWSRDGRFEEADLAAVLAGAPAAGPVAPVPAGEPAEEEAAPDAAVEPDRAARSARPERPDIGRVPLDVAVRPGGNAAGSFTQALSCAPGVADAAGGACLEASSTPEPGKLFPLGEDLLVRPGGQVSIGLDPGAIAFETLHVDGGAWFQEGSFVNGGTGEAAWTAFGPNSNTRGYCGLDAVVVPFFSGAWSNREVGLAGIALDSDYADNYGVLGRSNNVAVRGENDVTTSNFAELGTRTEGLRVGGSTKAARFLNSIETFGEGYFQGNLSVGGFGPFAGTQLVHARSAFDAGILIEADSDNSNEFDHPSLILSQDGGVVTARLTFAEGTNNVMLDVPYNGAEMYFRVFDGSGANDWEFQNFSDVEARITDLGNLQLDGSVSSPAADLAEYYPVAGPVQPGDVVAFDADGLSLVRATAASDRLAGVVSSNPGLLLGLDATDEESTAVPPPDLADDERFLGADREFQVDRLVLHEIDANGRAPLALSGRVPVRVSAENGPIRAGDLLTAARIPGHAAKAVGAGPVIGTALQPWSTGRGEVLVLAGLGWYSPDPEERLGALEDEVAALNARLAELTAR